VRLQLRGVDLERLRAVRLRLRGADLERLRGVRLRLRGVDLERLRAARLRLRGVDLERLRVAVRKGRAGKVDSRRREGTKVTAEVRSDCATRGKAKREARDTTLASRVARPTSARSQR
jgi:hypothetical protein